MTRSDLISDERFAQLRDMGDDRTVRERIEIALAHFYGPAGKARVSIVPVKRREVLRVKANPKREIPRGKFMIALTCEYIECLRPFQREAARSGEFPDQFSFCSPKCATLHGFAIGRVRRKMQIAAKKASYTDRQVMPVPMLPPAPVAVPSMFGGVSAPVFAPSKSAAAAQEAEGGIDYRVIQF